MEGNGNRNEIPEKKHVGTAVVCWNEYAGLPTRTLRVEVGRGGEERGSGSKGDELKELEFVGRRGLNFEESERRGRDRVEG